MTVRPTSQWLWWPVAAIAAIAVVTVWGWLRDARPSPNEVQAMQKFTRQMKTQCVGRFLIEVPLVVKEVSGSYETQIASVAVSKVTSGTLEDALTTLDRELTRREAALRADPMPDGKGSRFLELKQPSTRARLLHYMTSGLEPTGKIDGYAVRPGGVFFFHSEASDATRAKDLAEFIAEIEPTLSIRAPDEVPKTKGFCIDNGVVGYNPKNGENVNGWGWKLPDHPDVRFGLVTRTNDDRVQPGVIDREAGIVRAMGSMMMSVKTLRKRRFDLAGMKAQEWLRFVSGDEPQYQFLLEIPGKPNDNANPAIEVSMDVGSRGADGYLKPSLTEGEALALWDAVVGTLRLRPGAV